MGAGELKRWRDSLIADREDLLIGAARRWLGPVKTPFNKHEILERLESYLRKPATVAAVIDLLDARDRLAVASLSVMGDLAPAVLERAMRLDGSDLHAGAFGRRLANLRERMIVYRYRNARNRERIGLVPPLAGALSAATGPADLAAGGFEPAAVPSAGDPWALFCALFSACCRAKPAFRGGRELSRRALEMLSMSAPELTGDGTRGGARAAFLLDCLIGARALLPGEDGRPVPDPGRFLRLATVFGEDAPLALACSAGGQGPADPAARTGFLKYLAGSLPRGVAIEARDLDRMALAAALRFLRARAEAGGDGSGDPLENDDGEALAAFASVEPLIGLGLLERREDGRLVAVAPADPAPAIRARADASGLPSVVVEESHEIKVLPEASAADRAYVAAIARMERTGLVWTAVLDKDAALSAFSAGFDAAGVADRLQAMSAKPLPQSIRFSLDTWEAQARGVRVFQGVIARLDEHNAAMLAHSPKARGAIKEVLAEGVFLLDAANLKDAEKLLKRAGIRVEIQETVDVESLAVTADAWPEESLSAYGRLAGFRLPPLPIAVAAGPVRQGAGATLERLTRALQAMDLSPAARAVLADRLRSRLVLHESQLSGADSGTDTAAAGALDYPGKVRILERSMREGQPVEMSYARPDGSKAQAMGTPRELRKTPGGLVLMLADRAGNVEPVPVGAIERLRVMHTDIFGE